MSPPYKHTVLPTLDVEHSRTVEESLYAISGHAKLRIGHDTNMSFLFPVCIIYASSLLEAQGARAWLGMAAAWTRMQIFACWRSLSDAQGLRSHKCAIVSWIRDHVVAKGQWCQSQACCMPPGLSDFVYSCCCFGKRSILRCATIKFSHLAFAMAV